MLDMTLCCSLRTSTSNLCKGNLISRTLSTSSRSAVQCQREVKNLRKKVYPIQHFVSQHRFYQQFNGRHQFTEKLSCKKATDTCNLRKYSDTPQNKSSFSVFALKYGQLFVIFHGSCSLICTGVIFVLIMR